MKSDSPLFVSGAVAAGSDELVDVFFADGIVAAVAPARGMSAPEGVRSLDAGGQLLLPGLFDLHARIGITGKNMEGCVRAASEAAMQGGVTGLQCMPDTSPVLDNGAEIASLLETASRCARAAIVPAGCISQRLEGEQQAPYDSLRSHGVRMITDAGRFPHNILMLHRAMKYAGELGLTFALRGDVPALTEKTYAHPSTTSYALGLHGSPACAEEIGIETVLRLAADARASIHVQTVSTAGGASIIRRVKEGGGSVSAEVALHHLLYTHENIGDYDTNFKTLPPLRDAADTEALLTALNDGTIDCLVTQHSPCIPFLKKQDFCSAPCGMIALDTFLPALYTYLVQPGRLSWATLLRATAEAPRRLLGLDVPELKVGAPADFILFDPEGSTEVTPEFLKAGTQNTPLLGTTLSGKVTPLPLS